MFPLVGVDAEVEAGTLFAALLTPLLLRGVIVIDCVWQRLSQLRVFLTFYDVLIGRNRGFEVNRRVGSTLCVIRL